jgi:hypothetical protein
MISDTFRPILAPLVGAALCFLVSPRPGAATGDSLVAHYVARAVSTADDADAGRIDIYIERWSTDEALDALVAALKNGPDKLLPALQKLRYRNGVLTMPGVQGAGARSRTPRPRNLVFTQQIDTPTGRRIIVAADRHVGLGEYERWGASEEPEFTLIEIRLPKDGAGIGKAAVASNVVYNNENNTLEVAGYEKAPVRLKDIKAEKTMAVSARPPVIHR